MQSFKAITFSVLSLVFLAYCQSPEPPSGPGKIQVRLTEEPDRLHPMLSKTGVAAQVETKIFLPLINADPFTLELVPVLAAELPTKHQLENGGVRLDYQIRKDARWDNGSPVTAWDVLFTYKATTLPGLNNSSWSSYLNIVDSLSMNEDDPTSFSVHLSEPYILAIPATGGIYVYPEYYYDARKSLRAFSYSDLRRIGTLPDSLVAFTEKFNSNTFSRDSISGAGPYKLSSWQTGQLIVLDRKEDYWGEKYADTIKDLAAIPSSIQYAIIPEESTAIAMMRSNSLDILGGISPVQFELLKEDTAFKKRHDFKTTEVLQQYFVLLNMEDPMLETANMRKAVAYLVDKETFIQDALQGYGRKSKGPVHPAKPYFDPTVQMPDFNIDSAKALLTLEGWLDLDEDGYREKMVNGSKKPLEWTMLITGSPLGKSIALRLQENAEKVGARLQIETMPFRNILQRMREGDYQMTPLSSSSSPFPDDPFQSWHTSNIGGGGYNFTRFGDDQTDSIIEELRTSILPERQQRYYAAFQKAIAERQPAVFLAAPEECIIHTNELEITTTVIKPGYITNGVKAESKNEMVE